MSNTTQPVCVSCREPITGLVGVALYDNSRGWKHDCGVVFTAEFVADHYGIDLAELSA